MTNERNERGEPKAIERAEQNPIKTEAEWLTATEEGTGQRTLNDAEAVALGGEPLENPDEPVINGYRGGDHRLEPSVEEIRKVKVPKVPNIDY